MSELRNRLHREVPGGSGSSAAEVVTGGSGGFAEESRGGAQSSQAPHIPDPVPSASSSSSCSSSSGPSRRPGGVGTEGQQGGKPGADSKWECNICFEEVKSPVVTRCGHLYCWSCLREWLVRSSECPVCKAGVSKENVIPLYGRGGQEGEAKDPREEEEPPRPRAERPQPDRRGMRQDGGVGGWFSNTNVQFGVFPFFPLGLAVSFGGGAHTAGRQGGGGFHGGANFGMNIGGQTGQPVSADEARRAMVSQTLLGIGFFFLFFFLFVL
mmetsp:Transcript_41221/g.81289  ORF Transcript_41221/g.81289 Transcript_41221/m.81289 type:complete len:268 (-) Transcript_41221:2-805(-)